MQDPRPESYAGLMKTAMRKSRLSIRDLSRQKPAGTGYSYEHLRKIVAGQPAHSEGCNREICRVLDLDEGEMWTVATKEKIRRAYPSEDVARFVAPDDQHIRKMWPLLTAEHKQHIAVVIEGLIAEQHLTGPRTKEMVVEQIRRLTKELAAFEHQPRKIKRA